MKESLGKKYKNTGLISSKFNLVVLIIRKTGFCFSGYSCLAFNKCPRNWTSSINKIYVWECWFAIELRLVRPERIEFPFNTFRCSFSIWYSIQGSRQQSRTCNWTVFRLKSQRTAAIVRSGSACSNWESINDKRHIDAIIPGAIIKYQHAHSHNPQHLIDNEEKQR